MNTSQARIDPGDLTSEDMQAVDLMLQSLHSSPPMLVSSSGDTISIPEPVFHMLKQVLNTVRAGKSMFLIRSDETFTTQAAANFLGVSRPFMVSLLEDGKLPFHKVGSHRRVYFKDLVHFAKQRDADRKQTLDSLTQELINDGLDYDEDLI
jgi:excisionase family DNA binding protein